MKLDLSGLKKSNERMLIALIIAALLGAVWFVMIRAVLIDANGPHYHANFALYINGEQEMFEEGIFYEEVAACGGSGDDPKARVHLHDFINDVVHVHDETATWGHFFEVLGFTLGNNVLYARAQTYVDGQGGDLSFILNGEKVQTIASKVIGDEDRLLVSYGSEGTDTLMDRFTQIADNAGEYNEQADPAACQGTKHIGYWDRIKLVLGID